jgi:hypothetical protein
MNLVSRLPDIAFPPPFHSLRHHPLNCRLSGRPADTYSLLLKSHAHAGYAHRSILILSSTDASSRKAIFLFFDTAPFTKAGQPIAQICSKPCHEAVSPVATGISVFTQKKRLSAEGSLPFFYGRTFRNSCCRRSRSLAGGYHNLAMVPDFKN